MQPDEEPTGRNKIDPPRPVSVMTWRKEEDGYLVLHEGRVVAKVSTLAEALQLIKRGPTTDDI